VKKLKLENDRHVSTGWIRVAITVENSQDVEEPAASIGSQVLNLTLNLRLSGQDISTIDLSKLGPTSCLYSTFLHVWFQACELILSLLIAANNSRP